MTSLSTEVTVTFLLCHESCGALLAEKASQLWPKKMPKRVKSQQTRSGLLSHMPSFTEKKNNWSTNASFILIEEFAGLCPLYNMNHISKNVDIEDLQKGDNLKIQVLTHNFHFLNLIWNNGIRDACSTVDTFIHCHPFSSTFIHFHQISSNFIKFHSFSFTFIHFHSFSSSGMDGWKSLNAILLKEHRSDV